MEKKNLYKITLGNPTMGCKRYGICQIDDSDFNRIPMLLPHNIVWATIETTDNDLIFTFLRQTMTETTFKTHFSEGFFRIEKAFVWANRDILAGMYPLQLIDNELILKIPPLSAFCAITLCVTVFPGFEGVQNTKFLTNKTLK